MSAIQRILNVDAAIVGGASLGCGCWPGYASGVTARC